MGTTPKTTRNVKMEAIRKNETLEDTVSNVVKSTLKKKRAGAKPIVTAAKKAGIKVATIESDNKKVEIISEGASDDSFDLQNIEEIRSLVKEMDASKKQSQVSSKDAQSAKFSLTTSLIIGMFLQDQDKNVEWRNPTAKDIDNKRDGSRLLKASSLRKLNQLIEREIGVKSTSNSQGSKYKTIISKSIQNYKMGFGSKLKELHRQCGDDIQQLHSRFEMHLMSKDVGISSFTELDKRFRKPNDPEYKVLAKKMAKLKNEDIATYRLYEAEFAAEFASLEKAKEERALALIKAQTMQEGIDKL